MKEPYRRPIGNVPSQERHAPDLRQRSATRFGDKNDFRRQTVSRSHSFIQHRGYFSSPIRNIDTAIDPNTRFGNQAAGHGGRTPDLPNDIVKPRTSQ
jgi:hypothetical protein